MGDEGKVVKSVEVGVWVVMAVVMVVVMDERVSSLWMNPVGPYFRVSKDDKSVRRVDEKSKLAVEVEGDRERERFALEEGKSANDLYKIETHTKSSNDW